MTQELKPCPLCGGKPYLANVAMLGCAYVVCTDCRLQTDDGSADRVVANWNTREAQRADRALAEVARLQAKLAKAVEFTGSVVRYAGNCGDDYLAEQARAALAAQEG